MVSQNIFKNKKVVWVVIIVLLSLFFIQPSEKKEAGETVKFRASDLAYGIGSTISINLNCDGTNLEQHIYFATLPLAAACNAVPPNEFIIGNLPGNPDTQCINSPGLYKSLNTGDYIVCCDLSANSAKQWLYRKAVSATESSISTDPSREIQCTSSIPSSYQTFLNSKNSFLNGELFSNFITKANQWIQST